MMKMFKKENDLESSLENAIFFKSGDLVVLRHKELKSPVMLITKKISKQFKNENDEISNMFIGMEAGWFDKNNVWQTAVFSTKDLELYNKE